MTDPVDEQALAAAYEAGLAAEKAGDVAAAAAHFGRALALDPSDRGGVSVRLAGLGCAEPPPRAPEAYVVTLFDQHAEAFEDILVDQLGYATPADLRMAFERLGVGRVGRLLDLGCGTGLAAEALGDLADHLTGVDLSEGMLDVAFQKEIYDDLFVGDAEGFLEASEESWDAIVATDVFPYVGAVETLIGLASARLSPGGLFAFSTERATPAALAGRPWMVGPLHRYAHDDAWLLARLADAGLSPLSVEDVVVRWDEGAPVQGALIVARKSAEG
jgi:predicted TPR repeat methyltransferase